MTKYPLEWGWHTSNSATASDWKPRHTLLGCDPGSDGNTDVAAAGDLRCETCPKGGDYGSTGMYEIDGKILCAKCAVKKLKIEDLPGSERVPILRPHLLGGQ
jgi:hypothetical protein